MDNSSKTLGLFYAKVHENQKFLSIQSSCQKQNLSNSPGEKFSTFCEQTTPQGYTTECPNWTGLNNTCAGRDQAFGSH